MRENSVRFPLHRFSSRARSGVFIVLVFGIFYSRAAAQTWTLAWSDEFNGPADSAINPSNWQYDTGILNVNDEAEFYCAPGSNVTPCSAAAPNAYIDGNGHLVIQAIKVSSSVAPYSGSWTSARLNTGNNLQNFQYGRVESSMKLPVGAGLWPAFWALGNNINSAGWPASGEMDFMENVPASGGLGPTAIRSTIHGGNSATNCYCGSNGLGQSFTFPGNDANGVDVTSFHTYGAIWSTNMVQFYVDDPANVFFVRTTSDVPSGLTWDFNHQFFLLLNLAVGGTGSWPGAPDNNTPSPAQMAVDYVRVYQASAVAGPVMTAPAISVTAGQTGSSMVSLNSTAGTGRVFLSCTTTAPQATCAVTSNDPLNPNTIDFSSSATGTATVSVTTAGSTAGSHILPKLTPRHSAFYFSALFFPGYALSLVLLPATKRARPASLVALVLVQLLVASCGGSNPSSNAGGGTGSNQFSVTLSAFTISNSTGNPDSSVAIPLSVN